MAENNTDHTGTIVLVSILGTLATVGGLVYLGTRPKVRKAGRKALTAAAAELVYLQEKRENKRVFAEEVERARQVLQLKQAGARQRIRGSIGPRVDEYLGAQRAQRTVNKGAAAERKRQLQAELRALDTVAKPQRPPGVLASSWRYLPPEEQEYLAAMYKRTGKPVNRADL